MLADKYIAHQLRNRPSMLRSLKALRKPVAKQPPPLPREPHEQPDFAGHPAPVEHITTKGLDNWLDMGGRLKPENTARQTIAALLAAYPDAPVLDEDEDDAKAAVRAGMDKWFPAEAHVDEHEANQAAIRKHVANDAPYGPQVARLVCYMTSGGQKVYRTLVGPLSAVHRLLPDAMTQQAWDDADVRLRETHTPLAMLKRRHPEG